jgi:hypothetical protein
MSKRSHIIRKEFRKRHIENDENKNNEGLCDCPYRHDCMGDEKRKVKEELVRGGLWKQIVGEVGEKQAEEILDDMVREMMMG